MPLLQEDFVERPKDMRHSSWVSVKSASKAFWSNFLEEIHQSLLNKSYSLHHFN